MEIDSKYTKSFITNSLSKTKYNSINDLAIKIKDHKNLISKEVSDNLLYYLDFNFFDFLKLMRSKYNSLIPSNFDKQLYNDVYDAYTNKFKAITSKIDFNLVEIIGYEYYKKNTKKNNKGDFKEIKRKKKTTNLTTTLSYLARYGNDNTVNYINYQLTKPDIEDKKKLYYQTILSCINKFGFDKLYKLALDKRLRIIKKYNKPIEFKSLSFGGRSRLSENIISFNENRKSIIKTFINLSWIGWGNSISLPVKYNKDYHGSLSDYQKDNPDYEYRITFTNNRKIKVNICKHGKRTIPENKENFIGIDVNVKHNLFKLSDGKEFDYDRKLLNDIVVELNKIDKLKKDNKDYVVGKKKQRKLNSMRVKVDKYQENICYQVCSYLKNIGKDHIVMENLTGGFGKSHVKDANNEDINFNRVVKELKICSLKDKMEHIARNYDISISLVQSEYTSKQCSRCGCIDDNNRLTQERFNCVECNLDINADLNAALNIVKRVSSTVLREKLLKQVVYCNNSYEPKKLKREKVKEVLLQFRDDLQIEDWGCV